MSITKCVVGGFKLKQCFGFGSALVWLSWIWIRIRIGNAYPDTEARNWPKLTNKPDFQPFKKAFVPTYVDVFSDLQYHHLRKVYFPCKNSAFCDGKVWPGYGCAGIRFSLALRIRIRIEIMWIHNTEIKGHYLVMSAEKDNLCCTMHFLNTQL